MDDLIVYDQRPLQASDVRAQVNLIQEVMKAVMQKDQHYGVIPGAGNKPTLFKAGAEKLMTTFRLAADPQIEDMSIQDVIKYRITCRLIAQSTGAFVGAGVGEASSEEDKYKWRGIVSEDEWGATPEDRRRIKFKRDGQAKQVRTNPADVANTILKMAKKRALVDAVLTVTGASDIFTQDIEDIPAEVLNARPPIKQPEMKQGTGEQGGPTGDRITEPQRKRFYAIAKSTTASDEAIKQWLKKEFGFESSRDILREFYEEICERVVKEVGADEPGAQG